MSLRVFTLSVIVFLGSAGPIWAVEATTNPIIRFTRSMAQLDRVSELCKDVETARYQTYSLLIRHYVKRLYDGEIPYWVLSDVKSRVTDKALCKWLISESLIHYQYAYQDYVQITRPTLMPPMLTEAMAQYGTTILDIDTLGIARPRKQ